MPRGRRLATALPGEASRDIILAGAAAPPALKIASEPHESANGPVESYFDAGAFTWYGNEIQIATQKSMAIVFKPQEIRILSHAATLLAPDRSGDVYVEFGILPKALAIRLTTPDRGIAARGRKNTPALFVAASRLVAKLKAEGWPVPGQVKVTWDERNRMLVAKRPEGGGQ